MKTYTLLPESKMFIQQIVCTNALSNKKTNYVRLI